MTATWEHSTGCSALDDRGDGFCICGAENVEVDEDRANRPAPRFQEADWVWTPGDWRGWVLAAIAGDGEWVYDIVKPSAEGLPSYRYAEHELTEAQHA